jgi:hypothetical protein
VVGTIPHRACICPLLCSFLDHRDAPSSAGRTPAPSARAARWSRSVPYDAQTNTAAYSRLVSTLSLQCVQVEQGVAAVVVARDSARRLITYQVIGRREAGACDLGAVECNVSLSFAMEGLYILSVFADGLQVPPRAPAIPARSLRYRVADITLHCSISYYIILYYAASLRRSCSEVTARPRTA